MLRSPLPRLLALVLIAGAMACSEEEPSPGTEETGAPAPRPLGTLALEEGGEPCGDGDRCIRFVVTCPQVGQPVKGYFVIDDPAGPPRGTVAMFSGGDGSSFAARGGERGARRRATLDELRDGGFRVVQVVWEEGWTNGAPEGNEGLGKLSCRPATATAWISDNLTDEGTPLCAGGGSGGAAQVSYLLSHYGMEDRLSLVVPFTGYWMGRIDLGCLDEDPLNGSLHYNEGARGFIDTSMGYPRGEGPCTKRDESQRVVFEDASIASGGNDYVHPNTLVAIVLAGADQVGALVQGHTYYERLVREGSPLVYIDIISGAPHGLGETGPAVIRDLFLRQCRPQGEAAHAG